MTDSNNATLLSDKRARLLYECRSNGTKTTATAIGISLSEMDAVCAGHEVRAETVEKVLAFLAKADAAR